MCIRDRDLFEYAGGIRSFVEHLAQLKNPLHPNVITAVSYTHLDVYKRQALLKARVRDGQLDVWDHELAEAGEPLTRRRQAYLEALEPVLQATAAELVPALGAARLQFQPGWARDGLSLADALLVARDRDLANGCLLYTSRCV